MSKKIKQLADSLTIQERKEMLNILSKQFTLQIDVTATDGGKYSEFQIDNISFVDKQYSINEISAKVLQSDTAFYNFE